jgi:hypothetical protein
MLDWALSRGHGGKHGFGGRLVRYPPSYDYP